MSQFYEQQVPEEQISILKELLNQIKPRYAIEIGSWMGNTTWPIAEECERNGGFVVCVDTWEGNVGTHLEPIASTYDVFKMFRDNVKAKKPRNIIPIMTDSLNVHFFKHGFFDFAFLDGDHRYSHVKSDIEICWKALRKGGLICGHDMDVPTWDERWIEKDFVDGAHHGVIKAVTESFPDFSCHNPIWWRKK